VHGYISFQVGTRLNYFSSTNLQQMNVLAIENMVGHQLEKHQSSINLSSEQKDGLYSLCIRRKVCWFGKSYKGPLLGFCLRNSFVPKYFHFVMHIRVPTQYWLWIMQRYIMKNQSKDQTSQTWTVSKRYIFTIQFEVTVLFLG